MRECIYCGSSKDITVSDIIPYALTNAKCTCSYVCKTHNSITNDAFESKMVERYAFLRNRLGFNTRYGGQNIKVLADYYINDNFIGKIKYTDTEYLLEKQLVKSQDGKNIYGNKKRLANVFKKDINTIEDFDAKIGYTVNIDLYELFASRESQRLVAKIAYEWYCKENDINGVDDRFMNIINFIINNDGEDIVELVDDSNILQKVLNNSFREGSHILFSYMYGKKICVIISLFNIICYKIILCSNNDKIQNEKSIRKVSSYNLDGTITQLELAMILNNRIDPISSDVTDSVFENQLIIYQERLIDLMNSMIITYGKMKNILDSLTKQNYLEQGIEFFQNLLVYQKNDEIVGCLFLCELSQFNYDYEDSFNNNIIKMLNANAEYEIYINNAVELKKLIDFDYDILIGKLKKGAEAFALI